MPHGPCPATNEHPRRDTDVILRLSKSTIEGWVIPASKEYVKCKFKEYQYDFHDAHDFLDFHNFHEFRDFLEFHEFQFFVNFVNIIFRDYNIFHDFHDFHVF